MTIQSLISPLVWPADIRRPPDPFRDRADAGNEIMPKRWCYQCFQPDDGHRHHRQPRPETVQNAAETFAEQIFESTGMTIIRNWTTDDVALARAIAQEITVWAACAEQVIEP